jgi:hypothetical protein
MLKLSVAQPAPRQTDSKVMLPEQKSSKLFAPDFFFLARVEMHWGL